MSKLIVSRSCGHSKELEQIYNMLKGEKVKLYFSG